MKSPDLLAKAQEHRDYARLLEERARALKHAENLRSQAQSLIAQADQIEGAHSDENESAGDAAAAVPEVVGGWPAYLFVNPYQQAQ